MEKIKYSRGVNKYDNCPTQKTVVSFDEFQELVLRDKSKAKGLTYICSPFLSGPHTLNPEKYAGANHWRLGCYVLPRAFLAFDFDGFESPEIFSKVLHYFDSLKGFGYTTASHTPDNPRARVILALSREVTREEGIKLGELLEAELLRKFGLNSINFDSSVYRGEQPIYTPVTTSIEYRFNGNTIDVDQKLSYVPSLNDDLALPYATNQKFELPNHIKNGEGREKFILSYSAHLRSRGISQSEIETLVLAFNKDSIEPPLDEHIVLDRARRYSNNNSAQPFFEEIPNVGVYESEWFETDENPAKNDSIWGYPQDIKSNLPTVPTFDRRYFPSKISDYITDIAERMSCPLDFPGIGVMVTMQAALGSRINCKPYDKNTWLIPCGGWGVVIAPPSSMKSAPLNEVISPLKKLDKEAAVDFKNALTQYEISKGIFDNEMKDAIKKKTLSPLLTQPEEPGMKRYLINDATYEKVIQIASHNPNGFMMFRDELISWIHSLNKDSQKEARGLFLTAWSGNDSYATDRIGRGHVRADNINISVLGTTQPNVLKSLISNVVHGGMEDDGLIARFQFAVYPDLPPDYIKIDRYPNLEAANHYEDLIIRFAKLDPKTVGAQMTADEKYYLSFDEEAQVIFEDWRVKLEKRLRDPNSDEHQVMLSHLGKYRSLFPKIALALHLAAGNKGPINKNSALRALLWVDYLEAHARRMYYTATNRVLQSAVTLSRKISDGKLKSGFTRSDVLIKEWADLKTSEEINGALSILSDMGWIRGIENRSTGGRPRENFYINPQITKAA